VELSGAEIVVQALCDEGVEYVLASGGAVLHIYDALFKQQAFKHILVRMSKGPSMRRMVMPVLLGTWGALVTSGPGGHQCGYRYRLLLTWSSIPWW